MRKIHRVLFILGIGILVANLALVCSADGVLDLGNVMPLGDSITDGYPVDGGYRDPLYASLTAAGHTLQFVGTRTSRPTALLTANGQEAHNGHPGFAIEEGSGGANGGIRDNIASYLSSGNPDIILLMVGTNDIRLDLSYDLATAPDRLSALLGDIATLQPNAHTIVANLIPVQATSGTLFDRAEAYNAAIPGVVAARQAAGQKISFLDMNSFLTAPDDLFDSLHPNAAGYGKMAAAWEEAIHAIPEPNALALAAFGLMSLLVHRRRAVVVESSSVSRKPGF